ncbi:MAG: hypothetical protein LBI14_09165 [Treponema sp.]|nr:hypothetical protein [Treponema sp.]
MKRIIYLLVVLFVLASCDKYSHLRHFISFEGGFASSSITYDLLNAELHYYYTNLILPEMAKYPDGFFDRIGLNTIAIVRNLKKNNVDIGGVASNGNHILFVDTGPRNRDSEIKHAFHHELNHCTDFYIMRNYISHWDQWLDLYHDSYVGGIAHKEGENGNKSLGYWPNLSGFLNNYSTLNQGEDRSEMMAFYLTKNENALFIQKAKNDEVFYQKAVTLFTFYKEKLDFNLLDEFLLKVNQ